MRPFIPSAVCALLLATPVPVLSQGAHTVSPAELDELVQRRVEARAADRATLEAFLGRPEVRRIAAGAGIDIRRAETAVALLAPEDAAALATQAKRLDPALAGGDKIVISTTAVIIGLLVLILILVAS